MDEPLEELEPLFDYSRVQPPNFEYIDDDDAPDLSPVDFNRKRNRSNANGSAKGTKKPEVLILDDDDSVAEGKKEDEDDWLAPPPKRGVLSLPLEDAAIIEEIRLKKQELQLLACSAETVMKAAIESAEREFSISAKAASVCSGDQDSQPPVVQAERAKIVISIQDKDGNKQFRIFKDERLEKIFKLYADKANTALENLIFSFDGEKVSPSSTPNSLGMEEEDMIEVDVKPH